MKKVTSTLAVFGLSAGMVASLGVAPATAAGACDAPYPPGSSYVLGISPMKKVVFPNAAGVRAVVMHGSVYRGSADCDGLELTYQYSTNKRDWHSFGNPPTTDASGSTAITVTVPYTFYARYVFTPPGEGQVVSSLAFIIRGTRT